MLPVFLFFSLVFSPAVFADHDNSSDSGVHQIAQAEENSEPAADNAPPEQVDVYALFWPVVPGTTVADATFFLKQIKEGFGGLMTFGEVNKAFYQTEIAEKRFVEANKLFEDKDYTNAFKSLGMSSEARKQALELKRKAKENNQDVLELSTKMVASFEKQKKALNYINTQLPEEQKAEVSEDIKRLDLQISEAK